MEEQRNEPAEADALSQGSVGKLLMKLALPAIAAQLVNLLYNLVDRIYIGHIPQVGGLALTGLGVCFPVLMVVAAFALLIGQGGAPRAAIAMGRGDKETAEAILGAAAAALAVLGLLLTAILELWGRPLLLLFGASENTLPYALAYLKVYGAGTLFVLLTMGLNLFITTQGFSKTAMLTVLIGAVLNIALDPLFIFTFNMGVRGAALATIISQGVSAVWVVCFLLGKKSKLKLKKAAFRLDFSVLGPVLALGVSPFIMSATESLISICFNTSLLKYGGDAAVGAMTILTSVKTLQSMPVQGLAQGAQPIISFNYGAGKTDRVKAAYKLLFLFAVSYTFLFWAAAELWPGFFVRLFNSESPALIETAGWALRIYMASSCIFGVQTAAQQTFVALGQSKVSLFIACLRKIILLIPLIYIFPLFFADKVLGVFVAEPVADCLSALTAGTLFFTRIDKILKAGPGPQK